MESFYVAVGVVLVVASVGWMVSSRARHRIKRFAVVGAVVALILAVLYGYGQKSDDIGLSSLVEGLL